MNDPKEELELCNEKFETYQQLIGLIAKYQSRNHAEITICIKRIDCNFCGILKAVIRQIQEENKIKFTYENEETKKTLENNGFCHATGKSGLDGISSELLRGIYYGEENADKYIDYFDGIFKGLDIKISEDVKNQIYQSVLEILYNISSHSQSECFYAHWHHLSRKKQFALCIVDTGIGFAESFNIKNNSDDISSEKAIKLAFTEGITTKDENGGIGLSSLKEIIEKNQGELYVISGDAFLQIKGECLEYKKLEAFYRGVMINMIFNLNEQKSGIKD